MFRSRLLINAVTTILAGYVLVFLAAEPAGAQQVTRQQAMKLRELTEATREAGQLYNEGKYLECAERITAIQQEFLELVKSREPRLLKLARPLYDRLARAHGLLDLEGAPLKPLPSWEEITAGPKDMPDDENKVSFAKQVAPWLVEKCGRCHITNRRGNFSMATFAELNKGVNGRRVIFPGDARGSRMVEVIETGDMPRGGGKVDPQELESLKTWIAQGAQFDGPSPDAPLASYARSDAPAAAARSKPPAISKPTGNETVSFARDIAPILKENCNGCHIAGRRASGGLRMDTFAQLWSGGDSGMIIAAGKPEESLLIKKLKGEAPGQRMPAGGRPPLSGEQIEQIATWIREGAPYDGSSPQMNIDVVINRAWAEAASHDELFARRKERALARWAKVAPNDPPATMEMGEVFVLGNAPKQQIDAMAERLSEAIELVKKTFHLNHDKPLLRGGLVAFLLRSRYDYSEFGRMTEGRELPQSWHGHWYADPVDVYVVLSGDEIEEEEQLASLATQVVAGAYLGALPEVPYWFAEGAARNIVYTNFRRSDPRVAQWEQQVPAALQQVDAPQTLLQNRLNEEAAGVIGMVIANRLMDQRNRSRFDRMLKLMQEGKPFDAAMTLTYGPPDKLIAAMLGKPGGK